MDKIGKFSGVSVPSTKASTPSVVSPQEKKISFTGQQIQEQKQTQTKQQIEKPTDQSQQQVKDKGTKSPENEGNFQVITGKDGRVAIKLTNVSENITFGKLSTRDLSTLLSKLNMPMTEDNLSLAKNLLKFKLPLTMENLQDVKTALAMMSQKTEGNMEAGVFMKLKSMGITPENAKALQTLFDKNPDIGKQLDQLQRLATYLASSPFMNDSLLTSLMMHVASLFGEMIAKPNKDEKKLAKKLKELAEEVGVEGEGGEVKGKNSGKETARGNLSKLKKKFNDKISTLKDYIAKDEEEILKETAELLTELDENLEAQKLINRAPSVDDDNFIYIQIPISMPDKTTKTVHLKLEYEYDLSGQKVVNPKKTRLEFSIKTEDMGIINIAMNIWKRRLSFQLEAEDHSVKDHINRNAPDLIRRLKDKAYKVADWECLVKNKPVCFPETLLQREDVFSELATLDVII